MPVIILGGIYAGIFTATEAAAVSIVYGTFVSVVLYKEISLRDIPRVAVESAKTAGKVLVIVAFASFFGRLLTLLRIPSMITTAVLGISSSPAVIMLIIISLLFVFGMVMDMSVSIILLVPIIQPIMLQLGLDPVHIAMIIVFALGIGLILRLWHSICLLVRRSRRFPCPRWFGQLFPTSWRLCLSCS